MPENPLARALIVLFLSLLSLAPPALAQAQRAPREGVPRSARRDRAPRTERARAREAQAATDTAPIAPASTGHVLVLPVTLGADGAPATGALVDALAADVLAPELARGRYEERESREPPQLSGSDIDRWLASSRHAVHSLARADYDAARTELMRAQELSERAVAELNREVARSQQLLDTCLYMVRALIETQDFPGAEHQALSCRRLVPRGAPSEFNHPPEVLDLLSRVDARLEASPPATLRVESEPAGCEVRLNGLSLGVTPLVAEELQPGEYRVQVECEPGVRGRVHRLDLAEGHNALRVDTALDRAVRSDGSLRLAYASLHDARWRVAHAARVGEVVGATEVWLARTGSEGSLRIERVDVAARRGLGAITVSSTALAASLDAIRIAGEPLTDVADDAEPEAELASAEHEASAATRSDRTGEHVLGVVLMSAGALSYGASFGIRPYRDFLGGRFAIARASDVDFQARQSAWSDARIGIWALPAAGALFASLAVPLLLPEEEGVPWWSWLVGSVGLAGVATSVGVGASSSTCPGGDPQTAPACVASTHDVDLAYQLGAIAAPFIAVPFVYLARELGAEDAADRMVPSVEASSSGITLEWSGTF